MSSATNPRDSRPEVRPPGPFRPPSAEEFVIEGARTLLHHRRDLPLCRVQLTFDGGATSDPAEKAGLADLSASLLREGAGKRDAVGFAEALDLLGASIGSGASSDATVVHVASLKRHLSAAISLAAEAILVPRFAEEAFARIKAQTLGGQRQRDEQPAAAAAIAAYRMLFGAGHPLARPTDGRVDTVERIGLADVRGRHAVSCAEAALVTAAGDVTAAELTDLLSPVLAARRERAKGLAARLSLPTTTPAVRADALRVVVVDRPGAPQSAILFAWPGPSYAAPERLAFSVATTVFGGSITSRLNANLRERHGFTYGARARGDYYRGRPNPTEGPGVATAGAAVHAEKTGAAVREFLFEFARMRPGDITPTEVDSAKATIRNARIAQAETLEGLMGDLGVVASYRLAPDRNVRDLVRLGAVDAEATNAAARAHLVPDGGVLVIAGDAKLVVKQIEPLGLGEPEVRTTP